MRKNRWALKRSEVEDHKQKLGKRVDIYCKRQKQEDKNVTAIVCNRHIYDKQRGAPHWNRQQHQHYLGIYID
jgi:hypothetical protein